MAYQEGDPILAAHFNTFRDQVAPYWSVGTGDVGFGQPTLKSAVVGERVLSEEWFGFASAVETIAQVQGTTLSATWPGQDKFEQGDLIIAFDGTVRALNPSGFNIQDGINDIIANHGNIDSATLSLTPNAFVDTFSGSWSENVVHEVVVDFTSEDDARYFFNTGGSLKISFSKTGGTGSGPTSIQNAAWADFLTNVGTISFNQYGSTGTGVGSGGIGFFNLTTSFQVVWEALHSGPYEDNRILVEAVGENVTGVNGGVGSRVRFRISFFDNHPDFFVPEPPVFQYAPYNDPLPSPDGVDGDLTTIFDVSRTTIFASIVNPSFTGDPYLADGTSVDPLPKWITPAGELGPFGPLSSIPPTSSGVVISTGVSAVDLQGQLITYSVTSGSLPPGVTLNTSTGIITGTAPTAGTYNFEITATDTTSNAVPRNFTITVDP